jgi:hypothetical protein
VAVPSGGWVGACVLVAFAEFVGVTVAVGGGFPDEVAVAVAVMLPSGVAVGRKLLMVGDGVTVAVRLLNNAVVVGVIVGVPAEVLVGVV